MLWKIACTLGLVGVLTTSFPVVARAAADAPAADKEEAEEGEPPEGCKKDWLCFKPPADENLHPGLAESKFKTYLVTAMLSGFFTQWLLPDADKAPLLDEDLTSILKAMIFPPLILSLGFIPGICCSMTGIGMIVGVPILLATYIAMTVQMIWVFPMTQIHIVNNALMRGKQAAAAAKPMVEEAPPPVVTPPPPAEPVKAAEPPPPAVEPAKAEPAKQEPAPKADEGKKKKPK